MSDESTPAVVESAQAEPSIRDAVNSAALDERVASAPSEDTFAMPSDDEPAQGESEPKPEEKPPVASVDIDALRAAVESGDVDAIAKMVGAKVDKITNAQWIRYRQKEAKLKERHEAQLRDFEARRSEWGKLHEQAKSELAPLMEAKQRYADGDITGAMQLVFGEDIDGVLEKGVKQKHGRPPELVKLEREQKEMREKLEAKERAERERAEAIEREQDAAQALAHVTQTLAASQDDLHVAASQDPVFMRFMTGHILRMAETRPDLTIQEAFDEASEDLYRQFSGASKSPLIKLMVSRRDQPVDESANQPGKVAARKAPASRQVSHVKASHTAVDAPVPDDPNAFGAMLRDAVNRAQQGESQR